MQEAPKEKFSTVDEYLSSLTEDKKRSLQQVRQAIKSAAPGAREVISYNIPAFKLNGMLVYYAAWKEHIGVYGSSASLIEKFKKELASYKISKGTIQFPLDQPMPVDLICKMVRYRVQENEQKASIKAANKKQKK